MQELSNFVSPPAKPGVYSKEIIPMMKLSIREARQSLSSIEQILSQEGTVTITKRGKEIARVNHYELGGRVENRVHTALPFPHQTVWRLGGTTFLSIFLLQGIKKAAHLIFAHKGYLPVMIHPASALTSSHVIFTH